MSSSNNYHPPPTPRLSFRQLTPMPPGHRPVFPPGSDGIVQDHASRSTTDAQLDATVFQELRPASRNDAHDATANGNRGCPCSICLWYQMFYAEFLKDWYKVEPGQMPPHPKHIEEDELIKSAITLFGYPTVPFPSSLAKSIRPSRETIARLQQKHREGRTKP